MKLLSASLGLLLAVVTTTVGPAARAQMTVEPIDPTAAEILRTQRQLQQESERLFEALRRQDARRRELADVAADNRAEGIVAEGGARLHQLDEAEVERIRAQLRLERLAREAEVRRRYREKQ